MGLENFQIWKIHITAKLCQEKVWDVIQTLPPTQIAATTSPTAPPIVPTMLFTAPTTNITSTTMTLPFTNITGTSHHADSWAVCNAKAASIIITYVSDQLALKVGELTHAKDMFNKLVIIHVNTNISVSAFYTFISMLNLKWDRSPSTLSNHISALSATDAKLTTMKKEIDCEFLTFILLQSLLEDNVWESFRATVLNLFAPGMSLTFSALSNQLTFTATPQQDTSSKAALKADSNAKSKFKNKLDMWCQFHNSSMHNTADCRTLKEKDDKKEKGRA
ncbi:hypothetical protein H2248_008337 [Termitomyces sp. 'cryptogamus']|nr:hypothetical protein H2248_008337 [Termitomyces sp. 'cryptogamus']